MGCQHGVQAQQVPAVSVKTVDASPTSPTSSGAGLLLGRVGERSPTASRGREKDGLEEHAPPTKSNKLMLPLRKEPDEAQLAQEEILRLQQAVSDALGQNGRLCILGGTEMRNPETKPLIEAIAERLSLHLPSDVLVLTGGLSGVQEQMAKSLSSNGFQRVVNLVHMGNESYGVGEDLAAGLDAAEKRQVFGAVGDIYLCFEGGPGVSEEARAAHQRGARVIPVMATGGASGGDFSFPQGALDTPHWSSSSDWEHLTLPLPEHREEMAEAVVRIIFKALQDPRTRGSNARIMQDSSPDVVITGPLWFMDGCGISL